jgi:hypothetical protein
LTAAFQNAERDSWAGWEGSADVDMNEGGLDTVSKILWRRIDDTGMLVPINPKENLNESELIPHSRGNAQVSSPAITAKISHPELTSCDSGPV